VSVAIDATFNPTLTVMSDLPDTDSLPSGCGGGSVPFRRTQNGSEVF
jgi:hypothetical protein